MALIIINPNNNPTLLLVSKILTQNVFNLLLLIVLNFFPNKLLTLFVKFFPSSLIVLLFLANLLKIMMPQLLFLVLTINNFNVKTTNYPIQSTVDKLLFNSGLKWLKFLKTLKKNILRNNSKNNRLFTITVNI